MSNNLWILETTLMFISLSLWWCSPTLMYIMTKRVGDARQLEDILAHRSLFWPLYLSSPGLYRHNTQTNFTSRTRAYIVVKLVSVVFLSNVEFHMWVGNFFSTFWTCDLIYIPSFPLKYLTQIILRIRISERWVGLAAMTRISHHYFNCDAVANW